MGDDDLHDELDAWLADDEHEWTPPDDDEAAPLDLRDERQVNAMLRKRARLVAERDRISEFVAAQVQAMREFENDRCAGISRQLRWLDRGLEQFARATLPALKRKSLPLPDGTLKLTAPGQASLVVNDVERFVAWVDADTDMRGEFVKREPKPVAAAIKLACSIGPKLTSVDGVDSFAVLDAEGNSIPGVVMTKPSQDRFGVTPRAYDQQATNPKET